MKFLAFAILCIAAFSCSSGELINAKILAPVKDDGGINGCAWSASSPGVGSGFVYLAEYDQSKILMNVDGHDTELALVSSRGNLKRRGSTMAQVYRSDRGAVVYATFRATWLCPEDGSDESCEVTKFKASFEATTGTRRHLVHALGDVGC